MALLEPGDPAPHFTLRSRANPVFHFGSLGGSKIVLCFFGSTRVSGVAEILEAIAALAGTLSARGAILGAVSIDANDEASPLLARLASRFIQFWDFDGQVSRAYGLAGPPRDESGRVVMIPATVIIDEGLRVASVIPFSAAPGGRGHDYARMLVRALDAMPSRKPARMVASQAPVLLIPQVLDGDFCRQLIERFDADGGRDSGFMQEDSGKTVGRLNHDFKRRRDHLVSEPEPLERLNRLTSRRVAPPIQRAFQFDITRFERFLVACYDAEHQGRFRPHRDNTTKGTAHRRFAMTVNLNTGEYDGGRLRFPEFGDELYRPELGEAVIFSCSILHEAMPVTRGRRYALLSFFYGEEDAKLREANRKYVEETPPGPEDVAGIVEKIRF